MGLTANSLQFVQVYEVDQNGNVEVIQLVQKGENQYYRMSLQESGDQPGVFTAVYTPYPPQEAQPQPEA